MKFVLLTDSVDDTHRVLAHRCVSYTEARTVLCVSYSRLLLLSLALEENRLAHKVRLGIITHLAYAVEFGYCRFAHLSQNLGRSESRNVLVFLTNPLSPKLWECMLLQRPKPPRLP